MNRNEEISFPKYDLNVHIKIDSNFVLLFKSIQNTLLYPYSWGRFLGKDASCPSLGLD
jgi:hypothetical protein